MDPLTRLRARHDVVLRPQLRRHAAAGSESTPLVRDGAPEGLYRQGHNVMLYKDDVPNVEVGVQVTGSFDSVGRVTASSLPGGPVATATHIGPVSALGDTHQSIRQWSDANGYRPAGPRWEIYGDPDPSTGDFRVEVLWLLTLP